MSKATGVGGAAGSSAMRADEQRLDLVADERRSPTPIEQPAQRGRVVRRPRPRPSGRPARRRRAPAAAPRARPRVVEQERRPRPRAGRASHGSSARDPVAGRGPRSATGRRSPRRARSAGRRARSRPTRSAGRPPRRRRRRSSGAGRRAAGRDTASKSSESWSPPPSDGRPDRPRRAPARRPGGAGDARRRHGAVGRHAAERLGRVAGASRRSSPAGAR